MTQLMGLARTPLMPSHTVPTRLLAPEKALTTLTSTSTTVPRILSKNGLIHSSWSVRAHSPSCRKPVFADSNGGLMPLSHSQVAALPILSNVGLIASFHSHCAIRPQ